MAATFSESWHQVAPLQLALLPSVQVHKQVYRGQEWYVLQDVCSQKFFRVRPDGYRFICALSPKETLADTWQRFVERYPEQAPGQDDVIQLLAQLHHSNLLFFRSESDNDAIFKRFRQQKSKENFGKLLAFLYLRVPLWNPNDFLNVWRGVLSPLFNPWALLLWLLLVLLGGKAIVENWDSAWQQGQGMLALGNLPLLYISVFLLKLFHEMGHAIVCKKYGGEVHTMGVMFIVFTPLPYIDATASWSMRSRWQRTLVGAAGMYVELLFAALATLIWVGTGPGLINSLAFNILVAGSVSSILFNGNPLLRFDAYYMLADAVDIPNLYQRANQQWLYYVDRWLFGTVQAESPAHSFSEALWLSSYAVLSLFYRLFVMSLITLMVADIWLGLGFIVVIMMLFVWLLIPLQKLLKYVLISPRLYRNRGRARAVTVVAVAGLVALISLLPLPYALEAPGVIEARQTLPVFSGAGGRLMALEVRPGDSVVEGQLLMRFDNEELLQDLQITRHQLQEAQWRSRQALDEAGSDPAPFLRQIEALQQRQENLLKRQAQLSVRAPQAGIWLGSSLQPRLGSIFNQDELLGQVTVTGSYRFIGVVSQTQAAALFGAPLERVEIKFSGQSSQTLVSHALQFIPFQHNVLPSRALGIAGGGDILTQNDGTGREVTREAFFQLAVDVPADSAIALMPGITGYLRIPLGSRTLFWQVRQGLLQLIQRRYLI